LLNHVILVSRSRTHLCSLYCFFFSLTAPATTEIYTLSLHDALPISEVVGREGDLVPRDPHRLADVHRFEPRQLLAVLLHHVGERDRKSTRLNSSHGSISYAVFCLKKKNKKIHKNTINTAKLHIPSLQ